MPSDKMAVSELARRTGVTTATVNYYVQQKLLPPPEKPSKTRALYTEEHVRRIRYIKRLQANGYSLRLIRDTLDNLEGVPEGDAELLESIGPNYPIPPFRAGPPRPAVIDEPVDHARYVELTGLTARQVGALEERGILQLREEGRYDAGDVEVGQHVRKLLDLGLPFAELDVLTDFEPVAGRLARTLAWLFQVNHAPLARLELRHRDVSDPLFRLLDYLVSRTLAQRYPEVLVARNTEPPGEESGGL